MIKRIWPCATMLAAGLVLGAGLAIQAAPTSVADVCGGVGGAHVNVGGCTDPGGYVNAPPPPPGDAAPPPAPAGTACADVSGRHVSVGGCN